MYNSYYISLLLLFSFIMYFVAVDESVAKYIVLITKLAKINLERYIWMIRNHPSNPIVRYLSWKRSWDLAIQLKKEFAEKEKTP